MKNYSSCFPEFFVHRIPHNERNRGVDHSKQIIQVEENVECYRYRIPEKKTNIMSITIGNIIVLLQ